MSILFLFYFVLPALVLAHLIFGDRVDRWRMLGGFGLSMLVVGWLGYFVALLTVGGYRHHTLLLVNGILLWFGRRRDFRPILLLRRLWAAGAPRAESWVAASVLLAVGSAAFLLFDTQAFSNSCLHRALALAVGLPLGNMEQLLPNALIRNWVLMIPFSEREGAYAILAPFAYLFGFFGLRLFYALACVLTGVFGYLAARRTIPDSALGRLCVMALLTAFPLCADILWNDVNTVALFAAAALLWLAVEEHVPARWLGVFLGIVLAVRHEAVPIALGPLLLAATLRRTTWRVWLRYAAAALATLSPVFLRHALLAGSPFAMETFAEYSALPHEFAGIPFSLHGMLNFPFYSEIVRTPFNPVPLFVLWPVWLIARLGVVAAAAIAMGLATGRSRVSLVGMAAWVLPYGLLLAVNENWLQVEKMGAITPLMPPLLLCAGFGVAQLTNVRAAALAAYAATAALLYLASRAALQWSVPYDPRFYQEYRWFLPEHAGYLDVERSLLLPSLWPRPEWRLIDPIGDRGADLVAALRAPAYQERGASPRERLMEAIIPDVYANFLRQRDLRPPPQPNLTAVSQPVMLEVDLSRPWVENPHWLRQRSVPPAVGEVVFDLQAPDAMQRYARFPLPWAVQYPASLTGFRHGESIVFALSGPNRFEAPVDPTHLVPPPYEPIVAFEHDAPANDKIVLIIPRGVDLQMIEVVSFDPSRVYRWHAAAADPSRLQGPVHWRHD